jgi:hypothetical protein
MADKEDEDVGSKSWLRSVYWGATVIGPVATALAFMDSAAHQGSPKDSPMIGLEGGGAPNVIPYMFIALALVCISGAVLVRSMLTDPRPSIPGAVMLSILCFFVTAVASRPIFHAKWERDCDHGVGKACWAIGSLTTDPARKAELLERACEHGDPRGCGEPSVPEGSASAASSEEPPH